MLSQPLRSSTEKVMSKFLPRVLWVELLKSYWIGFDLLRISFIKNSLWLIINFMLLLNNFFELQKLTNELKSHEASIIMNDKISINLETRTANPYPMTGSKIVANLSVSTTTKQPWTDRLLGFLRSSRKQRVDKVSKKESSKRLCKICETSLDLSAHIRGGCLHVHLFTNYLSGNNISGLIMCSS